jgi:hypothetical protein
MTPVQWWLLTAFAMCSVLALYAPGIYAGFKAAANRKPGVNFWTAFSGVSLTFRPGLYTPEGLSWRKKVLWWNCVWVVFVFVGTAIAWATGLLDPFPDTPRLR